MRVIEYHKNGVIKDLFNKGFISINLMTYMRYNDVFEAYVSQGNSRNRSYDLAADECGCDRRTIITAVKKANS